MLPGTGMRMPIVLFIVLFYALPVALVLDVRIALVLWVVLAVLRFATVQRTLQAIEEQRAKPSALARIARNVDQYYAD